MNFIYGIVFISFGLGITLKELIGLNMPEGIIFLILGFILLIIKCLEREVLN